MSPRSRDSENEIRAYAFRLLGYRSRSRKELFQRLKKKGFPPERIHRTIQYLEDAGFLDDESLARDLVTVAVERKHCGRKGVENFLTQRGIDRELIDASLCGLTEEREVETAMQFIERKNRSLRHHPQSVVRRRIWGMLRRRGFSRDIINSALTSIRDLE